MNYLQWSANKGIRKPSQEKLARKQSLQLYNPPFPQTPFVSGNRMIATFGQTNSTSITPGGFLRWLFPWNNKHNPYRVQVAANYAMEGETLIRNGFSFPQNYGYEVAGNPSSPNPFRPQAIYIAPTVYINDRLYHGPVPLSMGNELKVSPVFTPAGVSQLGVN